MEAADFVRPQHNHNRSAVEGGASAHVHLDRLREVRDHIQPYMILSPLSKHTQTHTHTRARAHTFVLTHAHTAFVTSLLRPHRCVAPRAFDVLLTHSLTRFSPSSRSPALNSIPQPSAGALTEEMLPDELKGKDESGRRGSLVRALRAQSSKQLMSENAGGESDETKGDAIKRSTTSDHRQSTAGGPDWLTNVKHWLGQAVSGHAGRGAGPGGLR